MNVATVVFAIVYTGDQYVVDAFAGGLYALVAWWIVSRFIRPEPAS